MSDRHDTANSFLESSPRLGLDDTITFRCHKDVPCFNECCHDLDLMLTAYDVLRLRQRLGITSDEFIDVYTSVKYDDVFNLPVVRLKMLDDERKSCPYLSDAGCKVYEDRPWACRSYPVGSATSRSNTQIGEREYFFVIQEPHCKGFLEDRTISIRDWMRDQDIETYNANNDFFKELTRYRNQLAGRGMDAKKQQMFFMACYNLEKFRDFVFNSSFLEKFDVDEETRTHVQEDDAALLQFAFKWLKFSLFNEKTMKLKHIDLDNVRIPAANPEMTF